MPRTEHFDASMEPSKNLQRKYDLEERLLRYAAMIIRLVEELPSLSQAFARRRRGRRDALRWRGNIER